MNFNASRGTRRIANATPFGAPSTTCGTLSVSAPSDDDPDEEPPLNPYIIYGSAALLVVALVAS